MARQPRVDRRAHLGHRNVLTREPSPRGFGEGERARTTCADERPREPELELRTFVRRRIGLRAACQLGLHEPSHQRSIAIVEQDVDESDQRLHRIDTIRHRAADVDRLFEVVTRATSSPMRTDASPTA